MGQKPKSSILFSFFFFKLYLKLSETLKFLEADTSFFPRVPTQNTVEIIQTSAHAQTTAAECVHRHSAHNNRTNVTYVSYKGKYSTSHKIIL